MMIETTAPFFESGSAATLTGETLADAGLIRIATAYFEASGYQVLQDVLAGRRVHLLIGREDGGRDRLEAVLDEFVDRFLSRPLERRTEAMKQMLRSLEDGLLRVSIGSAWTGEALLDARYLYQHAKLYIADARAAVVTSANFSHHGLKRSIEAGIRVIEPADVQHLVERFDHYFDRAISITQPLIERLQQLLALHPPYDVYARALLELYDLPEDAVPEQLPALSDYQRPVVSRTLEAIRSYRGAMMIASTGLGKTVMAAHIAAYLRMNDEIDRVMVICPAGLRENWRRHMRMARISSVEFSYSTFSLTDPARRISLRQLEYELKHIDRKTLVLIDESHHLRNFKGKGKALKERYRRVRHAIHERDATALLLTATPFSRHIGDVNAQLGLLPMTTWAARGALYEHPMAWKIRDASEFANLPPCPTLTTPTVVNSFSQQDEYGHRYVEFVQGGRRYFPHRIHLHAEQFSSPTDTILAELLSGPLLNLVRETDETTGQMQLALGEEYEMTPAGKKSGLIRAELVKQFCSSPAQVQDTLRKLQQGKLDKAEFADKHGLAQFIGLNQQVMDQAAQSDAKLERLIDIIQTTESKVVVFCHYRATARYVDERLREAGIASALALNRKGDQLDSLLRRFAPIANEAVEETTEDPSPKVLVVTNALAEGFNLQDASVLVNYDLPWTVLMLAQRMGRVLRPWIEPREITIYNFIPEVMFDQRVQIAMDWYSRLQHRNSQHRALADIPVMQAPDSNKDEAYEMAALAQNLSQQSQPIMNLDEVLTFIERAEDIHTSSFLTDLLQIRASERDRISSLLPGYRSTKRHNGQPMLFLLLRHRKRIFPVVFRQDATIKMGSELPDKIMQLIRCDPGEPVALNSPDDAQFDSWIERARATWSREHQALEDEVSIICALALVRPD